METTATMPATAATTTTATTVQVTAPSDLPEGYELKVSLGPESSGRNAVVLVVRVFVCLYIRPMMIS